MKALENSKDMSLIGQFGVGFYSAFLVADTVVVKSTKDTTEYIWESSGGTSFFISQSENTQSSRGTTIELHLKDDCTEYLEEHKIKELVKQHSQYISFPIKLQIHKTREIEVEAKSNSTKDT